MSPLNEAPAPPLGYPILRRGSTGEVVKRLQFGLAALYFHPGPADGVYGPDTERAVLKLQYASNVYQDGQVNHFTAKAYNDTLMRCTQEGAALSLRADLHSYRIPVETRQRPIGIATQRTKKIKVFKADGIKVRGHEDAIDAFAQAHAAVLDLHGPALAQCVYKKDFRCLLDLKPSAFHKACSLAYMGKTFRIKPNLGLQNPHSDPFIVTFDDKAPSAFLQKRTFRVYMRVPFGEVPSITLNALATIRASDKRRKAYTQIYGMVMSGPFVDFTEMLSTLGFKPVAPSPAFLLGGSPQGAHWGEFQYERGLIRGITTFGEELQSVIAINRIYRRFEHWHEVKHMRFGSDWD